MIYPAQVMDILTRPCAIANWSPVPFEVEGVSGKYFVGRREERTSDESYDRAVATRLWKVSEELTATT